MAYAVDVPTGVTEEGVDPEAVVADITVTVGFPKQCLFRDDATNFVGKIQCVPLDALSERQVDDASRDRFADANELSALLPRRKFDSHKGDFGRIGIVAGLLGVFGAGAAGPPPSVQAPGRVGELVTDADENTP